MLNGRLNPTWNDITHSPDAVASQRRGGWKAVITCYALLALALLTASVLLQRQALNTGNDASLAAMIRSENPSTHGATSATAAPRLSNPASEDSRAVDRLHIRYPEESSDLWRAWNSHAGSQSVAGNAIRLAAVLRARSELDHFGAIAVMTIGLIILPWASYLLGRRVGSAPRVEAQDKSRTGSGAAEDYSAPIDDDALPFDLPADFGDQREAYGHNFSDVNLLLQEASHRFEELFQSLPVACFCYDADGRIFEWNRASEKQYGLTVDDAFQQTIWDAIGLPEDVERVKEMTRRVFSGEVFDAVEWEHVRKDGTRCRVLCNTFPLCNSEGAIVGAISANADISELQRAQQHLRESEERFRSAIQSMQEGLILIDADLTIRLSNKFADNMFCGDGPPLTGRNIGALGWEFVAEDGSPVAIEKWPFSACLKTGVPQHEVVLGFRRGEKVMWLQINCAALTGTPNEKAYAVVTTISDITQRRQYEQQLKEQMVMLNEAQIKLEQQQVELMDANVKLQALATLDGLTGLKNHRAFQERLDAEYHRSMRYKLPLSVVLLDVDKFKSYNDTYGHPAGDEVLKTVARVLTREARVTDLVARYGGEEFTVVLSNTDAAGAMVVAERMRAALESAEWKERPVTASFGVATLGPSITGCAEMIAEADRALYHSKENGRNRVTHVSSVPSAEKLDLTFTPAKKRRAA